MPSPSVQFMDEQITKWDVDVFYLDTISAGNPLITATYEIFKARGFFNEFKLSPPSFVNFISVVQSNYHDRNPYHNAIHAADVVISTNYLLRAKALEVSERADARSKMRWNPSVVKDSLNIIKGHLP